MIDIKVEITRVWEDSLDEYKSILDKYNPVYDGNVAIIEFRSMQDLFLLSRELGHDLIISSFKENHVDIYDGYIE